MSTNRIAIMEDFDLVNFLPTVEKIDNSGMLVADDWLVLQSIAENIESVTTGLFQIQDTQGRPVIFAYNADNEGLMLKFRMGLMSDPNIRATVTMRFANDLSADFPSIDRTLESIIIEHEY